MIRGAAPAMRHPRAGAVSLLLVKGGHYRVGGWCAFRRGLSRRLAQGFIHFGEPAADDTEGIQDGGWQPQSLGIEC